MGGSGSSEIEMMRSFKPVGGPLQAKPVSPGLATGIRGSSTTPRRLDSVAGQKLCRNDINENSQMKSAAFSRVEAPTIYYFISDLHIGGDGALDQCDFEPELIAFLRRIADGPGPAELIIIGDAFGIWELTEVTDDTKIQRIAGTHGELFEEFREAGRRIRITLVPGNHDYELACIPAYEEELAQYNIHVEAKTHITREVAGRKLWIEHGNQHDAFNTFPDFGNRYGMPSGYFITASTVAAAGRSAQRGRSL